MVVLLKQLVNYCDSLLSPEKYKDYCPNGLQIEGRAEVRRIVSGVTASQALLDRAVALEADLILVHHGYFWKGEPEVITGMKKRRLQTLLSHDISLLAYHLPLDGHPELGNNACLARQLGLQVSGGLEPDNPLSIGLTGRLSSPVTAAEFSQQIATALGREVLHIDGGPELIETVGWCTGAAQGYIEKAAALGLDAFISGEISEPTVHSARELGIHYFAAGHHATERYGVQALGERLAEEFDIEHQFVDIHNPV
ncbi:Nif3-like dinuclear metal center hexameric protein [Amphritea sp. 2_MG-2023]|uniref:Nif3-like dinuclear metal center hexameric protein n=1 Tax=Amphritea TaxID=515417 RepID=UPI001C07E210|nr:MULTISPECIES: Nif3-like dinuclear metal center hexameric protein [Amphritea]MBU2966107.1 Nif3-like dinuclear metal center hexameric protein [Amphritea atlantica]MDO6418238.1 Nif3-like dinuclear metal center hexameric protein [Amphritea sp. 2_MG-2023]